MPSDSENYEANNELSSSPPSSSSSPLILYRPPTFWSLVRGAAINLILPFVNGLMLGFGELFAHEIAFRLGWSNTRVCGLLPKGSKCVATPNDTWLLTQFDLALWELRSDPQLLWDFFLLTLQAESNNQ